MYTMGKVLIKESTLISSISLRKQLHQIPEFSGEEVCTKKRLMEFLKAYTTMEIVDCGKWFYAVHRERNAQNNLAIRADFDAVTSEKGTAEHLCGHDGHSAILCGLALELENMVCDKNIFLIFQYGEENGEGGKECAQILKRENIERIYGLHNIPGYPEGTILLRHGTFACASMGMTVTFYGAPTHAAYPEDGKNPAYAIANMIAQTESYQKFQQDDSMVLCTVIGTKVGEKAFGVAASSGELWLTIRAEKEKDLYQLKKLLEEKVKDNGKKYQLDYQIDYSDVFPETVNHQKLLNIVKECCMENQWETQEIKDPFRWSEDFGWYQKEVGGVFLGLGSGENHPQLHTADYEFPDEIIKQGILLWKALILKRFI